MKMILADGTELTPILVTGEMRHIQGADRDTLSFVFDAANQSLDALDAVFTAAACESITLISETVDEEGNVYVSEDVHKGYTVRAELHKGFEEAAPSTPDAEAEMVERIIVSMAQRTYTETRIKALSEDAELVNILLGVDEDE